MIQKILYATVLCAGLLYSLPTSALRLQEVQGMAVGDADARIAALTKAVVQADDKTAAFIQALADDAVKTAGDKVFIVRDGKATDPVTGQAVTLPDGAEDVIRDVFERQSD